MAYVSVIIPCFNAAPWVREALESVGSQGVPDVEIIVVDDGSTDSTARIVEEEFPSVRLIKTENQGPSRTRNLGTRMSSGKFVQYLDADDLLAPGKLRVQCEALERSGADVAYGDWEGWVKQPDGRFLASRVVKRQIEGDPEIALFTDFWCPPAAYLFRRGIVEQVGGWNETLPIIQDARFALDCAFHNAVFRYCSGVMAYYRRHSKESVSQRDPVGFVRDCLRNAEQVEAIWRSRGGITEPRKRALIEVYQHAARNSYGKDAAAFEQAYASLERLSPGYCPRAPALLSLLSRFAGYRRAEGMAYRYRRVKNLIFPRSTESFR